MRSFRNILDLADRVGFVTDDGGQVFALPFAEGITLTTVVDDWSRARVPLAVNTIGSRLSMAAGGAGQFNVITFEARGLPAAILFIDTAGAGAAVTMGKLTTSQFAALNAVSALGPQNILEGDPNTYPFPPSQPVFAARGFQAANPSANGGSAGFSLLGNTNWAGSFLPLYVMPGEVFAFSTANANVQLNLQLVWRVFLNPSDVITSQAPNVASNV